jgi:hypothetical protein
VSIDRVYVNKVEHGVSIGGKVKFATSMFGSPPGYMEISVIAPGGNVLYKAHADYYRYGKPIRESDTFDFSLTIPLMPPKGSTVRLMHHS